MSKTQIFALSALSVFLIVGSLIAGLVVVPIVKQNKAIENARIQENLNMIRYNSCMQEAYDDYNFNWENNCKGLGRGGDCQLPRYTANDLDSQREKDENYCIKMFAK